MIDDCLIDDEVDVNEKWYLFDGGHISNQWGPFFQPALPSLTDIRQKENKQAGREKEGNITSAPESQQQPQEQQHDFIPSVTS